MKCVSSGQFVTHFVLRVAESKHTCQQLQGRTNKHGRRALCVLLLSVFKLPLADGFHIAWCYIIVASTCLYTYVCVYIYINIYIYIYSYKYIYHHHVQGCYFGGLGGGHELLKTMMTFGQILQQPMTEAEVLLCDLTCSPRAIFTVM